MKRYFLLILSLITFSGVAQGQTTMDSLTRYKWEYIEDEDNKLANSYLIYTNTTETNIDLWIEEDGTPDTEEDIYIHPYYLMPLERFYSFDESKVGKVKNGKVIVTKTHSELGYALYWIKSLTNQELVLVSMTPGGPPNESKWKAIPK